MTTDPSVLADIERIMTELVGLVDEARACGTYLRDADGFTAQCLVRDGEDHDHFFTARQGTNRGIARGLAEDEAADIIVCAHPRCGDLIEAGTAFHFGPAHGVNAPAGLFCETCYLDLQGEDTDGA